MSLNIAPARILGNLALFCAAIAVSWAAASFLRTSVAASEAVESGNWAQALDESPLPDVLLFAIPTCPACQETKRLLTNNCIKFETRNPMESSAARSSMLKLNETSVPVLIIGERKISGYHPEAILQSLKAARIPVGETDAKGCPAVSL